MKPINIGLALEHTLGFYREVLQGVREYGHEKPNWIFVPIKPDIRSLNASRAKSCDGFVGHVSTNKLARQIHCPWVNVSSVHPKMSCPRVMVDHVEVGRLAARYFLHRGFRRFAYVGYHQHLFSMQRLRGFRDEVKQGDCQLESVFEERVRHADPTAPYSSHVALRRWLVKLETPAAIFASNDVQGFRIAEACREQGIEIPEQLALMSVDNDSLLCDLAQPRLSSVALPTHRIGYEAAKLLDGLIRGRQPPRRPIQLPPVGIVERVSSNIVAVSNETASRALQFIRSSAHKPISVDDVAKAASVSRRLLERTFRKVLQRSVADEICEAHMGIARRLLVETRMRVSEIAIAAGFTDGKHFATVFRRVEGSTPTAYRGRTRAD